MPPTPSFQSIQDIITEECREAYNNLVEKPAKPSRFNYEIANLKNSLQLSSSMSALQVPVNKTAMFDDRDHASPAFADTNSLISAPFPQICKYKSASSLFYFISMMYLISDLDFFSIFAVGIGRCAGTTNDLKVPSKQAPRPNTLPNRGSTAPTKPIRAGTIDHDTNPLHILRDKNYRVIRPRLKNSNDATAMSLDTLSPIMNPTGASTPIGTDSNGNNTDDVCESPSYLTNTQYTFSERDVNIQHNDTQKFIGNKEIENLNPIPLPPRDRNKVLLTNVKRHVRKHPLIIPASGLQRTLSKVTTPPDEKCGASMLSGFTAAMANHDEIDGSNIAKSIANSNKINYNMPRTSTKPAEVMKLKQYTSSW